MTAPPDEKTASRESKIESTSLSRVVVPLLLLFGLQLSIVIGRGAWPPNRGVVGAVIVAVAVALIALVFWRAVDRAAVWLVALLARRRLIAAGVILFASAAYLYTTARLQGRTFSLKFQDEFSYATQTQMLANGRLWMPEHALADFFDSFQLLTRPVYASIYFPGAAAMYAPGVWLGLPAWAIPLLLSGACVALLFLIVTEVIDGIAAALAAVTLVGLTIFRLQSIMVMAQIPSLVACLAAAWCWLRWRRSDRPAGWAIGVGIALGWAAITRPVDALCFALPIGVAMLCAAAGNRSRRFSLAFAVAATAPFLALQLVANRGITGSFWTTPFSYYAARDYPGTQYGFQRYHPGDRPVSTRPQKQAYYESDVRPIVANHTPVAAARRWFEKYSRDTVLLGVPHALLIALLPAGVWAAFSRRWILPALVAPMVLFAALYWPYAFFLPHYTLIAAPAVILLMVLGRSAVQDALPSGRWRVAAGASLAAAIFGIAIAELPEWNRRNFDEYFPATGLTQIDQTLAANLPADQRAVVLFRYPAEGGNPHEEPVYNPTAAWPDDARVIRAHDLGDRNMELFGYYAQIQPDRIAWRYDRANGDLVRLGRVSDLAAAGPIIDSTPTTRTSPR